MRELSNEKRGLIVFAVVATLCLIGRGMMRPGGAHWLDKTLGGLLPRTGSPSKLFPGSEAPPDDSSGAPALSPPDSSSLPGLPGMRNAASSREDGDASDSASAPGAPGASPTSEGQGSAPNWQMGDSSGGHSASAGGGAAGGAGGRSGAGVPGGAGESGPGAPSSSGGPSSPGGRRAAAARAAASRNGTGDDGLSAGNKGFAAAMSGMPGAADMKAGGAGAPSLSAAAAAMKGAGGGGGGDGGAGGGAGGDAAGAELSGAPGGMGKPTGSAGPSKGGGGGGGGGDAGGAAGAAGAAPGGARGGAPSVAGNSSGDDTDVPDALVGAPHPSPDDKPVPAADAYAETPGGPPKVKPTVFDDAKGNPVMVQFSTSKISADDPGTAPAFHFADGAAPDPNHTPYVAVPPEFMKAHRVKLGDYVAVTYLDKTTFGIVAEQGQPGVVGTVSPAFAKSLHFPIDPSDGAPTGPVVTTFYPNSGAKPPLSHHWRDLQNGGSQANQNAGATVQ